MAANRTSLSAGEIIHAILSEDEDVTSITKKIFPVVIDSATLPYILYRRTSMQNLTMKGSTADSSDIEILCFADSYEKSIELAESVRHSLDHQQAESDGLVMRSCDLTDAEESWQDDAYVQKLIFTIKI